MIEVDNMAHERAGRSAGLLDLLDPAKGTFWIQWLEICWKSRIQRIQRIQRGCKFPDAAVTSNGRNGTWSTLHLECFSSGILPYSMYSCVASAVQYETWLMAQ